MKNPRIIGILILAVIVIAAVFWKVVLGGHKPVRQISGFIGGEKTPFMEDPEVQKILRNRYGLDVHYSKAGSIEMVKGDNSGKDFVWPSSQVALEIMKLDSKDKILQSEVIFNSPIVLYSWDIVTDALIKQGIVKQIDTAYYIVDFPALMELVLKEKKWKDIGLNDLYGKISIISTDPTKSNSGNMFAGLLANILNGDVVDETSVEKVLPKLKSFYSRLGYLEHSSQDIFESYLRTGVGAKPIIVGYENQIIEFSVQHQDAWPTVKDKMRILYPIPTVWSEHPMIALTPAGQEFIKALKDPDLQKIAWERHGFRTGLIGVENSTKSLAVPGLAERIDKVVQMPKPRVMDRIINELQ